MSLPSPTCTVLNGPASAVQVSTGVFQVNGGQLITVSLANTASVTQWSLKTRATDNLSLSGISVVQSTKGFSTSFIAPAAPFSLTLDSSVTDGFNDYSTVLTIVAFASSVRSVMDFGAKGDGVTDDSTAFQNALNTVAGTGVALFIPGSSGTTTYVIKTPLAVSSNTTLIGSPTARISVNITPGGNPLNSTFVAQPGANSNPTTLSSAPTLGSDQISVAAKTGMAIGTILNIADGADVNHVGYYIITKAITGTGPFTVTLDRPIIQAYQNGSAVNISASIPQNIVFIGNGMSLSGTCSRHFEFQGARHCIIENFNIDALAGNWADTAYSWDTGSYDSEFRKITIDGGTTVPSFGTTIEASENCGYVSCTIRNVTASTGFLCVAGCDCYYRDCNAVNCLTGINLTKSVTIPCFGCSVEGGHFDGNVSQGMQVDACQALNAVGFTANYNAIGIQITANALADNQFTGTMVGLAAGTGVTIAAGAATQYFSDMAVDGYGLGFSASSPVVCANLSVLNATDAVVLNAGADGSIFVGVDTSFCSNSGATSPVDSSWSGFRCKTTNGTQVAHFRMTGGNVVNLSDATLLSSETGGSNGIYNHSTGRLNLTNVEVLVGTNGIGIPMDAAGVIGLANVKVAKNGSATGTTGISASNGTIRFGPNVDVDNTATPTSITGSGVTSRGTVTANGTTNVNITWPDAKTTDRLVFTLRTIGGTVGHPKYTITAGTQFVFTSDASDTSVYEYNVQ